MSGINYRPHSGRFRSALAAAAPQRVGTVTSVLGLGLEVSGLDCAVGDLVTVGEAPGLDAEVVASVSGAVRCMPLGRLTGVAAGDPARSKGAPILVPTGRGLLFLVDAFLAPPVFFMPAGFRFRFAAVPSSDRAPATGSVRTR